MYRLQENTCRGMGIVYAVILLKYHQVLYGHCMRLHNIVKMGGPMFILKPRLI